MTSNHHASDPGSPGSMDLAVALFRTAGPVPFDDVDWETFHNRLAGRAELSLARLRYPHLATQIAATTRISPEPELHLQPESEARYELVNDVFVAAKRVGVTRLGFVGNETYRAF